MKVTIATGKFHAFTNDDFAYLQKALALGEKLIIIVGESDVQNTISAQLSTLKFTEFILQEEENENPYQNELARLVGYRETSPDDNVELIYVENPDEKHKYLREFCSKNGISYIS